MCLCITYSRFTTAARWLKWRRPKHSFSVKNNVVTCKIFHSIKTILRYLLTISGLNFRLTETKLHYTVYLPSYFSFIWIAIYFQELTMWTMFQQSVPATRRHTHHVTNILPRLTPKKTRTREIIYCHISEIIIITIFSLNHLIFFSTWCSCLCFPTSQKLLYGISTSYYDAEQGIVNQIQLN